MSSAPASGRITASAPAQPPKGAEHDRRIHATVGDERVEGAEIIGYDPALASFRTQYFGSDGPSAYEASLEEEDGALVWRMQGENDRFAGTFADHGDTLEGHWEARSEDATWRPWMDIALTRQA
jgi:hypothetical protein